jgi:hypothetical protein
VVDDPQVPVLPLDAGDALLAEPCSTTGRSAGKCITASRSHTTDSVDSGATTSARLIRPNRIRQSQAYSAARVLPVPNALRTYARSLDTIRRAVTRCASNGVSFDQS